MIYIITHRKIEDQEWPLLQVGYDTNTWSEYRDNTGENISRFNYLFLETCGIYWIWKNDDDDIKGCMQLRRRLNIEPHRVESILKEYDIILSTPLKDNVYSQYKSCHDIEDLDGCRKYVNEDDFDKYILNGKTLYYSNSFICHKDLFNDICSFVFKTIDSYFKEKNYYDFDTLLSHVETIKNRQNPHRDITWQTYQMRLGGYLFERLFTLYIMSHDLKVYDSGKYIFKHV